jgi:hypothetical protein
MSVWKTLSAINVNDHVEKKGTLSYLSWAWAWGVLMEHYPDAAYAFDDPISLPDGSCEVWVTVTIDGISRRMWLPVMDNRNNSIANPSSRHISDTRMRCLVKCLAMFGLGHYIYAGEDLPAAPASEEQIASVKEWIENKSITAAQVKKRFGHDVDKLTAAEAQQILDAMKEAA